MAKKKEVEKKSVKTEIPAPESFIKIKSESEVELITMLPKNSQIYTTKKMQVRAVKMQEPFAIKAGGGGLVLAGKAGDYLVESPEGNLMPVGAEAFLKAYEKA